MMTAFTNHLPVKIRCGDGVSGELTGALAALGDRPIVLVLDEGSEAVNPAVGALVARIRAELGDRLTVYDKPAGEPTVADVDAATAAIAGSAAGIVVAIGGGSVLDTAKAARLCADLGVDFRTFLADRSFPPSDRVLVAVPTTAGTGSEVSGGSVISDPDAGRKSGIAHPNLRAQLAFVDPELTHSMPPGMTANTGIDALAQAIAGMVASCRTPIGDAIALEAIRLMGRSLVRAVHDGTDRAARSDMACGSMMAGLTMNISDCTAEHSLGQAIGGMKHIPHGLTIGLVLVETLDRERRHVPGQLERVADALGVAADGSSDGSRAVGAIRDLLRDLRFPVLRDVGVTEPELELLTDMALDDYFITQSPSPWSRDEVLHAFRSAYELEHR